MPRPAGTPNKASGALKEIAQRFGLDAIQRLADLAGLGAPGAVADTHSTQVLAIRELLDRGYGKATQPIGGEEGKPLIVQVDWAPAVETTVLRAITETVTDADTDELDIGWGDGERTC
jgi:hypothetical protein